MDQTFDREFSPKIYQFALEHLPPSSELTFEQIQTLAKHARYRLKGNNLSNFMLYSINGGDEDISLAIGIENGLRVDWQPLVLTRGLSFFPHLATLFPGRSVNPSKVMLKNLEGHLYRLGLKTTDVLPWPDGESMIILPASIRVLSQDPLKYIYLSEFKTKYRFLYWDLKIFFRDE